MALESRELWAKIDLDRKHQSKKLELEDELKKRNTPFVATIQEELKAIERRQQAKGVTRFFRKLLGKEKADTVSRELHLKTLNMVQQREAEERQALYHNQEREKARMAERYQTLKQKLEAEIRARDDNRTLNRTRTEAPPGLGKPAPTLEPRPPWSAGPINTPQREASFNRAVKDWAASEQGRKAVPQRTEPAKDWAKASTPSKSKGFTRGKE